MCAAGNSIIEGLHGNCNLVKRFQLGISWEGKSEHFVRRVSGQPNKGFSTEWDKHASKRQGSRTLLNRCMFQGDFKMNRPK